MKWPSFLVSTAQAVYHIQDKQIVPVLTGQGLYYGMSWDKDNLYVVARENQDKIATKSEKLLVMDHSFKKKHELDLPGTHHHQVIHLEGSLIVVDSGTNSLYIYRHGAFDPVSWRPTGNDLNHFNSIWYDKEEELFYVVEHNQVGYCPAGLHFNTRTEKKLKRKSRIVILDKNLTEVDSFTAGYAAHNVYREGSEILTFSSHDGRVLWTEQNTKKQRERFLGKGAWLRGFAVTRDCYIVGVSECKSREDRESGDSAINLYDKDFNLLDVLVLPESGQLCDIRIVNERDYAHKEQVLKAARSK